MTANSSSISVPLTGQLLIHWITRGLEAAWLLAVVLIPLAFLDREYARSEAVLGYLEVPKVSILRTLAAFMAILWLLEWGIQGRFPSGSVFSADGILRQPRTWLPRLIIWLREHPTRWLFLAVGFYLGTTLLTTALSGSVNVSLWGEIPGQDGYSAYTIISYVVLFGTIATHLKTEGQLWRLLGALVIMGVLVSGYAILQHYGHDFLHLTESTGGRTTSFMGNTIFAATVMAMTLPITLSAAVGSLFKPLVNQGTLRGRAAQSVLVSVMLGIWGMALAIQLLGLTFTFSRGAWIGALFAFVVVLVLMTRAFGWGGLSRVILVSGLTAAIALGFLLWQGSYSVLGLPTWTGPILPLLGLFGATVTVLNWRILGRVVLVLGLAAGLLAGIILLSTLIKGSWSIGGVIGDSDSSAANSTTSQVAERFSSIGDEVLSGFSGGRGTHWKVSRQLISDRPWFEFDSLSLRWLRPLVGYGPDLFRYTYLLKSPPEAETLLPLEPDHAHNFFIHQTVEQGYLGLISSLGIFLAVLVVGIQIIFRSGRQNQQSHQLILTGILAVIIGRLLEMMVGVARVSDLTILWVLLAIFAALPMVKGGQNATEGIRAVRAPRRYRRLSPGRSTAGPTASLFGSSVVLRLALVAWLIGAIAVLTWIKGVNYVRAAIEVGQAVEEFDQRDLQNALAHLDRAIELAPDAPHYHNYRAQVFFGYQTHDIFPRERQCDLEDSQPYKVCLAVRAVQSNIRAVEQRPFYYRSRVALANSASNLPELLDETVRYYQKSLALVPNSWAIRNQLAHAYLRAGHPEDALRLSDESLAITGNLNLSAVATFLEGAAYRELGQTEKSVRHIELSLELGLSGIEAQEANEILGNYYVDSGQFQKAIEHLDRAILLYPHDPRYYALRGNALSKVGSHEAAIRDLEEAIKLDSGLLIAFGRLGESYLKLGLHERAIQALDQAVSLAPDNGRAIAYRGNAFSELGQNQKAFRDLDEAIRISPDDAITYFLRGLTFSNLGQHQRAIQDLDEAIRLAPEDAGQFVARAEARQALGQLKEAAADHAMAVELSSRKAKLEATATIEDLEEAIKRNAQISVEYQDRALAYHALGRYEEAIQDFDQALKLHSNVATYFNRGVSYNANGQYHQSIQDYDQAIGMSLNYLGYGSPQYFSYFFSRGLSYFDIGMYKEAISDMASALRFDHYAKAEAHVIRGISYSQLGQPGLATQDLAQYEHAIENLNFGFRLNPEESQVYYLRGLAFLHLGQYLRSIPYFDEAIRLNHPSPQALLGRAQANRDLGQESLAIEDLNQAIRLAPQDAKVYFTRATVYLKLKQYHSVISDVGQAVQLNPYFSDAYGLRGVAYGELGQFQMAQADYALAQRTKGLLGKTHNLPELVRIGPQSADDYNLRGLAHLSIGRSQEAIRDFNQALLIDDTYTEAYLNRGIAKYNLGQYHIAISDLDIAIASYDQGEYISIGLAKGLLIRGILLGELGQPEHALRDLSRIENAIDSLFGDPSVGDLGIRDVAVNEVALQRLNSAVNLSPKVSRVNSTRMLALSYLGRLEPKYEQ